MEIVTGPITPDELEEEIAFVFSHLHRFGILSIDLEYGGGCDFNRVPSGGKIELSTLLAPSFIDERIEEGIMELGRSELLLNTDEHDISILVCEICELHCTTKDMALLEEIYDRWLELYNGSYETKAKDRLTRFLSSSEWVPF